MALQKDPEGTEIQRLRLAVVFKDKRVLEIGSGDGRLTWRYAHSASSVTGVDLIIDALQQASASCPAGLHKHVSFTGTDARNLPFPSETFDITILSWSF